MEFRLIYEGQLLAETQRTAAVRRSRADHKHEIRKKLHPQIRKFWSVQPTLLANENWHRAPESKAHIFGMMGMDHKISALSTQFSRFGYNFVPLASSKLEILCELDLLFLRATRPGGALGDLDNRLKTLFDALTMPADYKQVGKYSCPEEDEMPFFCLLEDDHLISKVSVETDYLLRDNVQGENDVVVIMKVRLRPGRITSYNIPFI